MNPIQPSKVRRLLVCGILAALLYLIANIVTPLMYSGYDWTSYTVSELSAVDAPTRALWIWLVTPYGFLMLLFGIGVWKAAEGRKALRYAAAAILIETVLGFFWPPMHKREVIAAGGGSLTDTLHIVFTAVWGLLMMSAIVLSAVSLRGRFAAFSVAMLILMIVFGAMTKNLPTPMMGVWERVNITAYLLWIAVFALVLLKESRKAFTPEA